MNHFTVFREGFALRGITHGEELICNYFDFDPSFKASAR